MYSTSIEIIKHNSLGWWNDIGYIDQFIVQSRIFRCSLDQALRSFYRAVNGSFGKVWRTASEEVVFELIKTKCLPILLYSLEAWPLNTTNLRSLDFAVNRFFMNHFKTKDTQIVTKIQLTFGFRLPSAIIANRVKTFA